jgi:Alkaline phosphatase
MQSVNLYEEDISTIVEDAMKCGKAAGVVSSKPILHATPGTFISHSNNRKNVDQMRRSFRQVSPTLAIGTCAGKMYPFPDDLESMRNGKLSSSWALFEQKPTVMAEVRTLFGNGMGQHPALPLTVLSFGFRISMMVSKTWIPTTTIMSWLVWVVTFHPATRKSFPTEEWIPAIRVGGVEEVPS